MKLNSTKKTPPSFIRLDSQENILLPNELFQTKTIPKPQTNTINSETQTIISVFELNDLLDFIFPSNLQHPLAAARLYVFGFYGPLDKKGKIRTGFKRTRILADYELDEMCRQFEREDVIRIYLHDKRELGNLSRKEQEIIISQADGHLKKEKGQSMLPKVTKEDVIDLFSTLPRDESGRLFFSEAQTLISNYREQRIARYKLVYPNLKRSSSSTPSSIPSSFPNPSSSIVQSAGSHSLTRPPRFSESVAPVSMFRSGAGLSDPDINVQRSKELSFHSFSILDAPPPPPPNPSLPPYSHSSSFIFGNLSSPSLPSSSTITPPTLSSSDPTSSSSESSSASSSSSSDLASSLSSNVSLLRSVHHWTPNPASQSYLDNTLLYTQSGERRVRWDDTSGFRGSGTGSLVKATPSSSTWKRKNTLY